MEKTIIYEAEFTPRIKKYIFLNILLLLIITVLGIPLIVIWVLGYGQYISRKYYERLECKLTKNHLEFKKGLFFRVEKTIPLENIQDMTFIQNPILNWFDLKILKIETAGNSSSTGADMKLIGIIDSENFKNKVLEQRELLQSLHGSETDSPTLTVLKEIRNVLEEIHKKKSL